MTHLIQQHYLNVELKNGGHADGLALQQRLPDLCRHRLLPAIEQVLDKYVTPEQHWYIDHLDIEVGDLSLPELEDRLANLVAQAMDKALQEKWQADTQASADDPQPAGPLSETVHIRQAWIYFLRTGTLPWPFHLPPEQSLEEMVRAQWASDRGGELIGVTYFRQLLTSAVVRKRLVWQFSTEFLLKVLAVIDAKSAARVRDILEKLEDVVAKPELSTFQNILWEHIWEEIAGGNTSEAAVLVEWTRQEMSRQRKLSEELSAALKKHWPIRLMTKPGDDRQRTPMRPESTTDTERDQVRMMQPERQQYIEPGEGFYIENAGLILLHPFLPTLFGALEIADQKELLQPDRALCLLHYLATGQVKAPEHALILPKVLCDLPVNLPVPAEAHLTKQELEEADALLSAVVRHWEALRDTSIDGLRGNFLLRPGKLSLLEDDSWRLQVEHRTYDILLDQLPWGITLVKLPWMRKMLHTEWV